MPRIVRVFFCGHGTGKAPVVSQSFQRGQEGQLTSHFEGSPDKVWLKFLACVSQRVEFPNKLGSKGTSTEKGMPRTFAGESGQAMQPNAALHVHFGDLVGSLKVNTFNSPKIHHTQFGYGSK